MNKDLIETPRFNFFIGDEVFLKGKIVGFDVDEEKFVENVVRLEYGQTLNVPNSNIHTTDNIVDKSKIKVKIPQFVADWIETAKSVYSLSGGMTHGGREEKRYSVKIRATKHYFSKDGNGKIYFSLAFKSYFTKKELEEAGFGWVFDCPGIEIKKVE